MKSKDRIIIRFNSRVDFHLLHYLNYFSVGIFNHLTLIHRFCFSSTPPVWTPLRLPILAVFTRFVQLARSVYAAYHHAEQIVLVLQCTRSVLPMFGFLGLLPLSPVQSTPVGTTGETDLPVPRRTAPPSPSHSKSNDLTVWPSISNSIAFRSHLRRMPNLNRIGWLKKYSRRGFQPRMVFLFDDRIVFTSRIRGSQLFLKVVF